MSPHTDVCHIPHDAISVFEAALRDLPEVNTYSLQPSTYAWMIEAPDLDILAKASLGIAREVRQRVKRNPSKKHATLIQCPHGWQEAWLAHVARSHLSGQHCFLNLGMTDVNSADVRRPDRPVSTIWKSFDLTEPGVVGRLLAWAQALDLDLELLRALVYPSECRTNPQPLPTLSWALEVYFTHGIGRAVGIKPKHDAAFSGPGYCCLPEGYQQLQARSAETRDSMADHAAQAAVDIHKLAALSSPQDSRKLRPRVDWSLGQSHLLQYNAKDAVFAQQIQEARAALAAEDADPYTDARFRLERLGVETQATSIPDASVLPDPRPEIAPGIQEQYGEEFELATKKGPHDDDETP